MKNQRLVQRMQAYEEWKSTLVRAIEGYQSWLDDHGMAAPDFDLPIFEALEALRSDRLTLAFVAEFSRGKSELINAIFFADYRRRLLPSDAGRTTMCPTELYYDREAGRAYMRLLPIETRATDTSIAEYKRDPIQWTNMPLHMESPEQMASALQEVMRCKRVSVAEAQRLGLYQESPAEDGKAPANPPSEVEIPMWRHAMISLPHPLLEQGLVVLDTPGLNALGNEPELTLNMLPSAQGILFVLAADTGVTRSDLEIWQHHIHGFREHRKHGLIVALNKIDTLWDELRDPDNVRAAIETQRHATADKLGVPASSVFPVSAHKGLLAKIRGDDALLQLSRLPDLEAFFSTQILPAKERIVRENIVGSLGDLIGNTLHVVGARLEEQTRQLDELKSLRGKNAEVIGHLMQKSREEQTVYLKNVESFQASRRVLGQQAKKLLDTLSVDALDQLVTRTRREMMGSWTSMGLQHGMRTFFEGARVTMQEALTQAEQTRLLISAIYRKFHDEHGLPQMQPKLFSVNKYYAQLDELYQKAEEFRKSPITAMTEQTFVVKKFFISLASHARHIFFQANRDAESWLAEVMNPLVSQIKEFKHLMEKRLETLRKINESRDTLESRIQELDQHCQRLRDDLDTLAAMRTALELPMPDSPAGAVVGELATG